MTITEKIAVYVGTYAKYNNGSIHGAWVDLEEFSNKEDFLNHCREIHRDEEDPEFMFQDFEGFPEAYYGESGLDPDLWDYLKKIEDEDKEIIDTLVEHGYNYDQEYISIVKSSSFSFTKLLIALVSLGKHIPPYPNPKSLFTLK